MAKLSRPVRRMERIMLEVGSVHVRRRAQRPSSGSGEAPRVSSRVCHWKVQHLLQDHQLCQQRVRRAVDPKSLHKCFCCLWWHSSLLWKRFRSVLAHVASASQSCTAAIWALQKGTSSALFKPGPLPSLTPRLALQFYKESTREESRKFNT